MPISTCHHLYPPFSDSVAASPLTSLSLVKLQNGDETESAAFFRACRELGFFYLNFEGSPLGEALVENAERLHELEKAFFALPREEKRVYARDKIDPFFGYREVEQHETYNLRKDDLVGIREPLPVHQLARDNHDLLKNFALQCREVIDLLISHLETHLQLEPGTLAQLHRVYERSGDHIRFNQVEVQPFDEAEVRRGEHTDFGTLTVLFNWLGGLQIKKPGTEEWVYVRPVPGSAVVNLGDALVKFTAGLLRSNVHRVVPAPPPQDKLSRNSLVYFSRPEDSVVLRRLKGGLIDAQPEDEQGVEMTAQEWILRRGVGDMQGIFTHGQGLQQRRTPLTVAAN